MPAVSVVIPCYNTAAYLPTLFAALRAQTLQDVEFLFVDDGATDASPALLDAFAASEPRARVIHVPNGGVSRARNLGVQAAYGDYISFCDSDDVPAPAHYATLLQDLLDSGATVALVNGLTFHHRPGDEGLPLFLPETPTGIMAGDAFLVNRVEAENMPWTVFLALTRRDWLLARGIAFPEGIVHEDVLWYVHLLLASPTVHYRDSRQYHYRSHLTSITHNVHLAHRWHRIESYCRLIQLLLDTPAPAHPNLMSVVAADQFRDALWLAKQMPHRQRWQAYRLFRRQALLRRLWSCAANAQARRRLARTWLASWLP